MIKPMTVEQNKDGIWVHPDFQALFGDRDAIPTEELEAWERTNGLEIAEAVSLEEDGFNLADWELEPPEGEGWFLLAINDTEDGPIQVWARQKATSESPA